MKLDIFDKWTKDDNLELRNYTKVESIKNEEHANKFLGNRKNENDNKIRYPIGINNPLNNVPFFIETRTVSKELSTALIAAEHEKRRRYWRTNFIIVLLPLVIYGVPIHLLLFGKRGINSVSAWFKQIFVRDPLPLRILTYIFFIGGLCINGFLIFVWFNLVTDLVIKGVIRDSLLKDFMTIIRVLPIAIPLDLFWVNYQSNGVI